MRKKIFLFLFLFPCIKIVQAQSDGNSEIIQNTLQNYVSAEKGAIYRGSSLPVFTHKEDTKGTRYLFDKWVKGTVLTANNTLINNKNYSFNYDKITSNLFWTEDTKIVVEINKEEFKSFTLHNEDTEYVFKHLFVIDNSSFFQVLVENTNKYSLYKLVHTILKKSDYTTDGIFENGNPYDEYIDKPEYYIIFPGGKLAKQVLLKPKKIKSLLSMETPKTRAYFSSHKADFVNETFLIGLIRSINQ